MSKPLSMTKPNRRLCRTGDKTQTRRLGGLAEINKDPDKWIYSGENDKGDHLFVPTDWEQRGGRITDHTIIIKCPHQVGEIVYIPEPYRVTSANLKNRTIHGNYQDGDHDIFDVALTDAEWIKWCARKKRGRVSSGMLMYKSLARDFYEILRVWIERTQDISPQDARAEGVIVTGRNWEKHTLDGFEKLWNSVNKARGYGYDKNTWNFAYEFKKIKLDK